MLNHHCTLWTLIKIYWSISWRATIFGCTLSIVIFFLCPIFLHYLTKSGNLEAFRGHFLNLFYFSGQEELIKSPVFLMTFYSNIWSFIGSYFLFFYGFHRILKLNLYPHLLKNTQTILHYNKVFLIPLLIYSFMDLNFLNITNHHFILTSGFFLAINGIYYGLIFRNLKKLIHHN